MFGYSPVPQVRLSTERLVVRLAHEKDAVKIAEYYRDNRDYLQPWEPIRDAGHFTVSGWNARLSVISEYHRQGAAFSFLLLDQAESRVLGVINYSNIIRGVFQACYLGYSLGKQFVGKGLMYEALKESNRYMLEKQQLHRIMANYMPHNQRSGNLLARLGFEQEGYAKEYLLINGMWQDHIMTALTNRNGKGCA